MSYDSFDARQFRGTAVYSLKQFRCKQFRCKQFHRKKRNCLSFNNGLEANQPSTKGRPNPIGQFPYILTTTMTTGSPDY